MPSQSPVIKHIDVSAYTVPTDQPESDGTHQWDSTTMVLVEAAASDETGLGYSYTHAAAAHLIDHFFSELLEGRDALRVRANWRGMNRAARNFGRPGLTSSAIAAVDVALWDLKARLLDVPLVTILDAAHDRVPVYGSGGFTSYSTRRLREQLSRWVDSGISAVKMKVGRKPENDIARVEAAREAIGADAELLVDANGAYTRKQALSFAAKFAGEGVTWFEEPVSSDDLEGLRLLRDQGPPGVEITAGEYGYDRFYFRRMLEAGAVDVLQADATRCGGITGFLEAGTLCAAHGVDLSAHTAPALHAPVCCAIGPIRHTEYFHDHVRIEDMFFKGVPVPEDGQLEPVRSRAGLGLIFKAADAEPYRVYP